MDDMVLDLGALWKTIVNGLEKGDPLFLGVAVAIIVGVLTIVALIVKRSGRSQKHGVLLLGICDAGKTLLYSQIIHNEFKQTCTSIKPNLGEYVIPEKNKKLRVIDLPGHERIRGQLLDEYKNKARALVFVIDSGSLQKEVKEVAEYLYTILSDKVMSSSATPILILCNKQDLTLAKGAKVIRSQLEKEMNTLRITRAAALQGVGDTGKNNAFLGKHDKNFCFSDLKPLRVDFAECSARGDKNNYDGAQLDDLYAWLNTVA